MVCCTFNLNRNFNHYKGHMIQLPKYTNMCKTFLNNPGRALPIEVCVCACVFVCNIYISWYIYIYIALELRIVKAINWIEMKPKTTCTGLKIRLKMTDDICLDTYMYPTDMINLPPPALHYIYIFKPHNVACLFILFIITQNIKSTYFLTVLCFRMMFINLNVCTSSK